MEFGLCHLSYSKCEKFSHLLYYIETYYPKNLLYVPKYRKIQTLQSIIGETNGKYLKCQTRAAKEKSQ